MLPILTVTAGIACVVKVVVAHGSFIVRVQFSVVVEPYYLVTVIFIGIVATVVMSFVLIFMTRVSALKVMKAGLPELSYLFIA